MSQDLPPCCLPGDSPYPYLASDNGCLSVAPHYDDWEGSIKDEVIPDTVLDDGDCDDDEDGDDPDSGNFRGQSRRDDSDRGCDLGGGDGSGGESGSRGRGDRIGNHGDRMSSHGGDIGHKGGGRVSGGVDAGIADDDVGVTMSGLFGNYVKEFNVGGQPVGPGLDPHFLGGLSEFVVKFSGNHAPMACRVHSIPKPDKYLFPGPSDDELVFVRWGDVHRIYARAFDVYSFLCYCALQLADRDRDYRRSLRLNHGYVSGLSYYGSPADSSEGRFRTACIL
ncbi:hypothetical protein LguiA_025747 [Lonicera macranthoides]